MKEPKMEVDRECWCGGTEFDEFSGSYLKCKKCKTLVLKRWPSKGTFSVVDDQNDFYGKKYYDSYLTSQYGYPGLTQRAISDLPERCLYWLRAIVKYKLPPGRALEVGCGHGGLVALLRWSGFDASGLELSPWLVSYARETFDIPMFAGPVEGQAIQRGSLDVIALMDVLEHLPDPISTIKHCLALLKPDGILVIQTPNYTETKTYEEMIRDADPFIEQLKAKEHLFLFSESSIKTFFSSLGVHRIIFERAIFSQYDMFFVASRSPLPQNDAGAILEQLTSSPQGRMVQALIDVDRQSRDLVEECHRQRNEMEADRAARLKVIEEQGEKLGEVEGERNRLQAELIGLREHFDLAEADRAARLKVIENQGKKLGEVEGERNRLIGELTDLREQFETAEADRAGRLKVIEDQGKKLGEVEGERNRLKGELTDLRKQFETAEADRAARLKVIEEQGKKLGEIERERNRLNADIIEVHNRIEKLERDCAARLEENALLHEQLENRRISMEMQEQQIKIVTANLHALQHLFATFQKSHVYRLLRLLGRLKWMERSLSESFEKSLPQP